MKKYKFHKFRKMQIVDYKLKKVELIEKSKVLYIKILEIQYILFLK